MRITLPYKGVIPAGKRPPEKIDAIRQKFHHQLNKIWGRDQLAVLQKWLDTNFEANAPDFRKVVGGRTYLPIASNEIDARVRLKISLFSGVHNRNPAYHGGDIDNRVKSLIDALSAPVQPSRIPQSAPRRDTICLLSDDSLVDDLTVTTAPLLAENNPRMTLAVIVADIVPGRKLSLGTLSIVV